MIDKKNTNYVPLTLNDILKKIKKNKGVKIENKDFSYRRYNKGYKKLDFTKDYFTSAEIREQMNDEYHKTWRILLRQGDLRGMIRNNNPCNVVYFKDNVRHICLLKEIGAQLEEQFFTKIEPKVHKPEYKPFHFDSAYRGDIYLFSYPKSREWKAKLLTDFLHTKEFLFDEDSPHWKGMKALRYFCLKNLMNSKVERWEYQVQRFLAKKD